MRDKTFIFVITVLIILNWSSPGFPYGGTHKAINEHIAQNTVNEFSLNDYLINNLGFKSGIEEQFLNASDKKTALQWLGYGGIQEDVPSSFSYLISNKARNNNHFHNPIKT